MSTIFATFREEMVRLDEEERALAYDTARQQDENDELDKQIAELSKVLEEQNALLSQEMAEIDALAQKEVDLEKELAGLKLTRWRRAASPPLPCQITTTG